MMEMPTMINISSTIVTSMIPDMIIVLMGIYSQYTELKRLPKLDIFVISKRKWH